MEYSPPPLFKQGASARVKVVFFAVISLVLLIVDARMDTLKTVRQVVATGLYPLQVAAMVPRDAIFGAASYFVSLTSIQQENETLRRERIDHAQRLQQATQYAAENAHLRRLLGMRNRLTADSVAAEMLYDARDAFTRKIILDRGARHGVTPGQPVIDDIGIVGQVTRVFPFTSEVTLLTDKNHAIPVQVLRSGVRSIAYGRGSDGFLDLRFVPTGADIQKDDVLITSGVDGVYPVGLSIARVVQVENKPGDAYARIVSQPIAGINRNRQLLILMPQKQEILRPPEESLEAQDEPSGTKQRAVTSAAAPSAEGAAR
jgi:rod shape-determining protein MreC